MEFVLTYDKRPWTVNAERTWHYHKRAKLVKEWREIFEQMARDAELPPAKAISLEVSIVLADNRLQDLAACFPAYKAALDGIVDSGIVPDDTPQYVKSVTFIAPVVEKGVNSLRVKVIYVD